MSTRTSTQKPDIPSGPVGIREFTTFLNAEHVSGADIMRFLREKAPQAYNVAIGVGANLTKINSIRGNKLTQIHNIAKQYWPAN